MSKAHSLKKSETTKSAERPSESERDSRQISQQQKIEIITLVRRISDLVDKKTDKAAIILTNWLKDERLPRKKK